MLKQFKAMLADESGATLIEYALIVSLISVAAIVALKSLSGKVNGTLTNVSGQMN